MTKRYSLTITTLHGDRLATSRVAIDGWAELEALVHEQGERPTCFSLSEPEGPHSLFLMLDDKRAHLSIWRERDLCHYLVSDAPEGQFIDIGWDSFPAWLVSERERALEVAAVFVEHRVLARWAVWRDELIEV